MSHGFSPRGGPGVKNRMFPEEGKHGDRSRKEMSSESQLLQYARREPVQLWKLLCPQVPKVSLLSFSILLDLF